MDRGQLKIEATKRLLRSRLVLSLAQWALSRRRSLKGHDRVAARFILDLAKGLYTEGGRRVVWTNVFVPSELIWGLGLVPFYHEIASALGAGRGLSPLGLERAAQACYPCDLCTVHRNAAGLALAGFFPPASAYVSTSILCDATGQTLANFAHQAQKPFVLIDVPTERSRESVAYVEGQLERLAEELCAITGVSFDPDRLRETLHLSNAAREYAQEVMELRLAVPAPLRGSAMLGQLGLITSIFGSPHGVAYYRALRDYTQDLVRHGASEQENQRFRLYWMHVKPYYPTGLFTHLEDELGAVIVFEELSTIWWEELDERRPLRALAEKMLANFNIGPVENRIERMLQSVEKYRAEGVVHFNHWGCRFTGGLRLIRDRLRREGIPFLAFDGDCIDETNMQWGQVRTRIEGFIEMLGG
ncbi:MAG: 2-hydroxyacyl-CoA dehydratase subunit D [Anaerolineae bacterium]